MSKYSGIAVSNGVSIGKAYLLDRSKVCVIKRSLTDEEIPAEITRLREAIQMSKDQLLDIKQRASSVAQKYAIILDTYTLLLEDDLLVNETIDNIRKDKINAEWALSRTLDKFTSLFNNINDDYLKGKRDDLDLVVHGVIKNLIGHHQESLVDIDEPVVIITHALSPSDTIMMNKSFILGMVTEVGGKTSHVAIFASALGIPAVVGVSNLTQYVNSGDMVIIDSIEGEVLINPDDATLVHYKKKQDNYLRYEKKLLDNIALKSETMDGHAVQLMGNIESAHEAKGVRNFGGEGIGLYRTEFLYLGVNCLPTENDLYVNFKNVAQAIQPYSVVIRTLDIGADKQLHHLDSETEANPALGLRGIRMSLTKPDVFISQLKAILRASLYGHVKILYPMITGVGEVREANHYLDRAKKELKDAQIPFDEKIAVGAMIETPSAAITVDLILAEVDFISIGTNDLVQYILAVDRINENVAHLYQPYHPSVLKILRQVFETAAAHGKHVAICGELGGDPMATFLLFGLGTVHELSMEPHSIPKVKKILRKVTLDEARKLADHAISLSTAEEVNQFITNEMRTRFPSDFDRDLAFGEKTA
ncbi:phosphoenolpyruvate--protein phosphotransferase [Nitrospina watsonii]|uniref:Phosphoenolpyruvate-protein phosphotransferase n=1 Tax=Nitrospina watsonii TaxID=1323948 RepID=A0ABM9HE73_9BACT|nr:phosphoenolpyruvate--protein phosphotransferase [Nitrospina watsonii]CAI2718477.1 Phosphoenolpyruvate-protein phosphotransferase [Nitrospina watsonii]